MSLRRMETAIEVPKIISGFGGFPQLPERKRWYACNIGFVGWNCYKLVEEVERPKFCPTCRVVDVPAYLPEFLDKYVLEHKFNEPIQVKTPTHPTLPETYCLSSPKPSSPHPGSPSVRQVPSVAYTGAHMPPKKPFQ